jgi:hypothetical protein
MGGLGLPKPPKHSTGRFGILSAASSAALRFTQSSVGIVPYF